MSAIKGFTTLQTVAIRAEFEKYPILNVIVERRLQRRGLTPEDIKYGYDFLKNEHKSPPALQNQENVKVPTPVDIVVKKENVEKKSNKSIESSKTTEKGRPAQKEDAESSKNSVSKIKKEENSDRRALRPRKGGFQFRDDDSPSDDENWLLALQVAEVAEEKTAPISKCSSSGSHSSKKVTAKPKKPAYDRPSKELMLDSKRKDDENWLLALQVAEENNKEDKKAPISKCSSSGLSSKVTAKPKKPAYDRPSEELMLDSKRKRTCKRLYSPSFDQSTSCHTAKMFKPTAKKPDLRNTKRNKSLSTTSTSSSNASSDVTEKISKLRLSQNQKQQLSKVEIDEIPILEDQRQSETPENGSEGSEDMPVLEMEDVDSDDSEEFSESPVKKGMLEAAEFFKRELEWKKKKLGIPTDKQTGSETPKNMWEILKPTTRPVVMINLEDFNDLKNSFVDNPTELDIKLGTSHIKSDVFKAMLYAQKKNAFMNTTGFNVFQKQFKPFD